MAREIHIKQGERLALTLTFYQDDAPMDLSTVTFSSQVRNAVGELIATLPITVTGTPGLATIQFDGTDDWPIGLLRTDVRLLIGGAVALTETWAIRVERNVTQ